MSKKKLTMIVQTAAVTTTKIIVRLGSLSSSSFFISSRLFSVLSQFKPTLQTLYQSLFSFVCSRMLVKLFYTPNNTYYLFFFFFFLRTYILISFNFKKLTRKIKYKSFYFIFKNRFSHKNQSHKPTRPLDQSKYVGLMVKNIYF